MYGAVVVMPRLFFRAGVPPVTQPQGAWGKRRHMTDRPEAVNVFIAEIDQLWYINETNHWWGVAGGRGWRGK